LNLDAIFITDLYNLRYFAGFTGTTGVGLATRKGNFFYSDFRYRSQGEAQVTKMGFEFVEVSRGSLQTVGEYIKKFGLKNVGFEDINVSFSFYQTIKDIFKVELVPVGNKLIMERMVKSEEEISKVTVTDKEVSEQIEKIKEQLGDKFNEELEKSNVTEFCAHIITGNNNNRNNTINFLVIVIKLYVLSIKFVAN